MAGKGNHNTAQFWEYDTRLGRRWNLDPVDQISYSNYSVLGNNPVLLNDPDGDCPWCIVGGLMLIDLLFNAQPTGVQQTDHRGAEAARFNDAQSGYALNVAASLVPGGRATKATATVALAKVTKEVIKDKVVEQAKRTISKEAKKEVKEFIDRLGKSGNGEKSKTSREARREVMREQGIPTSQQPNAQRKNASGREYDYEVPNGGMEGGTRTKSVQQKTLDESHRDAPHWEAGEVKRDGAGNIEKNGYGTPRLRNGKSKQEYGQ